MHDTRLKLLIPALFFVLVLVGTWIETTLTHDLPRDNVYTYPIRVQLWLSIVKTCTLISVVIAIVWFGARQERQEKRMDRFMNSMETWAQLGKDRREQATLIAANGITAAGEAATQITHDVTHAVEKAKQEIIETVPPATGEIVKQNVMHAGGESGVNLSILKGDK